MARAAYLMTTTSKRLAEVYREAGVEHIAVIDNHLARDDVVGRRRRRPGIVIGCTAGAEHESDLRTLRIGSVFEQVMAAYENVSVVMIALAPLVDTPFNRARSSVKLKEYAAGGAAWLAPPVGPYVGLGEAQGGLPVDDGDWYDAIEALVTDPRRRAELAAQGCAWAVRQRMRHGGDRWEAAFRAAVLRAKREQG